MNPVINKSFTCPSWVLRYIFLLETKARNIANKEWACIVPFYDRSLLAFLVAQNAEVLGRLGAADPQSAVEVLQQAGVRQLGTVLAVGNAHRLVDHRAGLEALLDLQLEVAQFLVQILNELRAAPSGISGSVSYRWVIVSQNGLAGLREFSGLTLQAVPLAATVVAQKVAVAGEFLEVQSVSGTHRLVQGGTELGAVGVVGGDGVGGYGSHQNKAAECYNLAHHF